jgi:hypothetical protein
MTFDELINFIENKMVISHVYQPLLIRALVDFGGSGASDSQVTLTFEQVTSGGETTVQYSAPNELPPSGYEIQADIAGNPVSFDLVTTASYAGGVQVCVRYQGGAFASETTLKLLHYWPEGA